MFLLEDTVLLLQDCYLWLSFALGSGSGSGYVRYRSQSMAISVMEQGERKICCFYIRPPLPLQSSVFIIISLGGHNNHVLKLAKTLLLSVCLGSRL